MDNKKYTKEIFEKMPVAKAISKMAVPTIIGQIIILIYNLADTFYVGRVNNPFMTAGVSLILPIFNITISIACLTGAGGGSYISRLLGVGREDEAKKVSGFSIYSAGCLAAVFSLIIYFFLDSLLHFLGADADTYIYAKQYVFCVIVLGAVPTVLANVFSNMLRSSGRSKEAGIGVALGGILNIALDPLFMFVILEPGSETLGVGIATLISNVISCIYYIIVIKSLGGNSVISFIPSLPSNGGISEILKVGFPAAISTFLFDIDYMLVDKLMSGFSNYSLAAIGIVLKAERLPLNIGLGLSQGMMPLVAYNFASGDHERMRKIFKTGLKAGIIIAVACVAMYEAFAPAIIRVFIENAQTVELGSVFLRARSVATPFMFLCFLTVHMFQSFGKGGVSLVLGVVRWACVNIPMLYVMRAVAGANGIVWSQSISDFFVAAVSLICLGVHLKKIREEDEMLKT